MTKIYFFLRKTLLRLYPTGNWKNGKSMFLIWWYDKSINERYCCECWLSSHSRYVYVSEKSSFANCCSLQLKLSADCSLWPDSDLGCPDHTALASVWARLRHSQQQSQLSPDHLSATNVRVRLRYRETHSPWLLDTLPVTAWHTPCDSLTVAGSE